MVDLYDILQLNETDCWLWIFGGAEYSYKYRPWCPNSLKIKIIHVYISMITKSTFFNVRTIIFVENKMIIILYYNDIQNARNKTNFSRAQCKRVLNHQFLYPIIIFCMDYMFWNWSKVIRSIIDWVTEKQNVASVLNN